MASSDEAIPTGNQTVDELFVRLMPLPNCSGPLLEMIVIFARNLMVET